MKKKISTIIEITDHHIKLLQAQILRGKTCLVTCDVETIESYTEDHLSKHLKKIAFRHYIQPNKLTLILPRKLVILKQIRIPSANEEEIDKMISLQLVNQIPYPIEDVVYDYYILNKEDTGYTTIMIVLAHKAVIDRYLDLLRKLDIHLNKLTISSLGILQLCHFLKKPIGLDSSKSILLVNIDAGHSELCFSYRGKLYFSRSIEYGTKDLNQGGINNFIKQIRLTLHTYQEEGLGIEIEQFCILSEFNEAELLKQAIQNEFNMPCEILSYGKDIPATKQLKFFNSDEYKKLSLSVGLGFLFMPEDKMLNFIPQEVYDTKLKKIKKRQVITFFSLVLLILNLIVGVIGIDIFGKMSSLKSLEKQLSAIQEKAQQAQEFVQLIKAIESENKDQIIFSDIIYELTKIVPLEISLRLLDLDEKGTLNIQGYAKTSRSINVLQEQLVKSPLFHNIKRQFSTKRKIFNMQLTDFKINAQIKNVLEASNNGTPN